MKKIQKITIEKFAEMSQREFTAIRSEMREGFDTVDKSFITGNVSRLFFGSVYSPLILFSALALIFYLVKTHPPPSFLMEQKKKLNCFFVLFNSCSSHARVFGKTVLHEFLNTYGHTKSYLLFPTAQLHVHKRRSRRDSVLSLANHH